MPRSGCAWCSKGLYPPHHDYPVDAAIALTIIHMAYSLKLAVIAEGVETAAQLAYLRRHRCDQIQGYYFSRPLPVAELEQMLREEKHLPILGQRSTAHPA